ncbi:transposase, putative [Heliomicrobium modesticaldum Ice1]|uniref:Transposase, putative n=1 Tax=Heliobacterium modesticaldum (strain ATCC 51547 / Ice1) TaxID=498761 RepID=B0TCJ4_HELMI|nr:DDE-type integrase/transposase/recombinase [Heliomicrobium modesticaldum]ABZ84020.1 transposase, putative [Heliomicrobium modesticaldum Ice1]
MAGQGCPAGGEFKSLEEAILLRREVPRRSIAQIIQILEWEGKAEPGKLKRSTLQEKLAERGYSTRHMQLYANTGVAARRFQQKHRNQLWHSDIKYGPYLPIGPDGAKKQVYLVTFFDDATRFVLHGQFYPTLDQVIVEDCFRQAILKYGAPEAVFFDNGKQYRTKWMHRACAKMGIRLLFAKPYSPESTGKVERFNRTVDAFLQEAALEKPHTLDRLNQLFWVWLDECYQNKPHSALAGNVSPDTAYRSDKKAVKFLDPDVVANAFLHCESRKVDKSGCISFEGRKYEVGLSFIGCTVDVIYDPADIAELTIEYADHAPWKARQLVIGERTGPRPKLPERLSPQSADSSRLLAAATQQKEQRKARQAPVVSYRTVRKEGNKGV